MENGTGTGVPASSTPVTFNNAANTCPAITMQSGTSQNDLLERFAQIPQEQMTEFFRALTSMVAGTAPSTSGKPSSSQSTTRTQRDNNLDESDNNMDESDNTPKDMDANSGLDEFEDPVEPVARRGRQLARTTMQKNEYAWVVGGQILPIAPITEAAPPSNNALMYTAYIMNNLTRSSADENMLWSILRSGGGVCSSCYTLYDVVLTIIRSSTSLVY